MRLLQLDSHGEITLTENFEETIPKYAILSHTWGADSQEVTFQDINQGLARTKDGYKKLLFCGKQAQKDGLQYFWVDTCCIDKTSSTELSEAIMSMFRWYRGAEKCYVYLSDAPVQKRYLASYTDQDNVTVQTWAPYLRSSKWFSRGWTLQELIAPRSVEFFSREEDFLGDKRTLEKQLHEITGIPVKALRGTELSQFSVDERLRWAENRNTRKREDKAYCECS